MLCRPAEGKGERVSHLRLSERMAGAARVREGTALRRGQRGRAADAHDSVQTAAVTSGAETWESTGSDREAGRARHEFQAAEGGARPPLFWATPKLTQPGV